MCLALTHEWILNGMVNTFMYLLSCQGLGTELARESMNRAKENITNN